MCDCCACDGVTLDFVAAVVQLCCTVWFINYDVFLSGVRYDSVMALRGARIAHGFHLKDQIHSEVAQAYPEYLVFYSVTDAA